MQRLLLTFLLLFSCAQMLAQQNMGKLHGTVQNEEGKALQGVEVYIQNSKFHTQTNNQGEYILAVPGGTHS
ncbi:carboxypeptidase regulatory-like domain-containing protein, partial [Pseudoxanthomonas sp. SGD-10]